MSKGCPRCQGAVYEAEKLTVKDEVYHKKCFTCKKCTRYIDSLLVNVGPGDKYYFNCDFYKRKYFPDQDIYCGVCYKTVTAPERPQVGSRKLFLN